MDKLSREKKDVLIIGDFNINLLNYNNDKDTIYYFSRCSVLQLFFPFYQLAYQGWKHFINSNRQSTLHMNVVK